MIRAYNDRISYKDFYFNLFGEAFETAGRRKDMCLPLSHVTCYTGGIIRPDGYYPRLVRTSEGPDVPFQIGDSAAPVYGRVFGTNDLDALLSRFDQPAEMR